MATAFQTKKQKILEQLEIPSQDYTDLSPKGSVDEGVRELVDEINRHDGFVTTSSCAGRVAVYLEGISKRARREEDHENEPAGIASGGKGGGQWLYVSHDPPSLAGTEGNGAVCSLLNLPKKDEVSSPESSENVRFVRLKFEPLILHILTASLPHAQKALSAALTSGFRESGISSITPDGSVVVAVRTAGLAFDSVVAFMERSGELVPMVQEDYLRTLLQVANERFEVNSERKERFREAFLRAIDSEGRATRETKEGWEPAEQRRERKRAEGLRRKAEVQQQKSALKEDERNDLES